MTYFLQLKGYVALGWFFDNFIFAKCFQILSNSHDT